MEIPVATLTGTRSGSSLYLEQVARGSGQAALGSTALASGVSAVGALASLDCPLAGVILLAPLFSLPSITAKLRLEGTGASGPPMISEEFELANSGLSRPLNALTLTPWTASTSYVQGDLVSPTTPNGRVYFCFTAGTSDTSEPAWPEDLGYVEDGTAFFLDLGISLPVASAVMWEEETNYSPGALVYPSTPNGRVYSYAWPVEAASDEDEPTWPEDLGFVADGTVLWQDRGPAHFLGEFLAVENLFGAVSVRPVITEAPASGSLDLYGAAL